MSDMFDKLPKEFAQKLQSMIAANKSAKQLHAFIYTLSGEQARELGFSRTELYNYAIKKSSQPAPQEVDQEPETARVSTPTAPKDGTEAVPAPVIVDSENSENSLSESSDETEALSDLDLEFASIGVPELQGMILKKESFKALRRLVLANTRPRKAMSTAKMHLPSQLARTDKMLESCVDQTYLVIAALEGGQTEIARVLLNNLAANLEVERRSAIVAALGVEDEATDISRDCRTDLFSFEERERLPSFRDQQKSRKSQPRKAKAKPDVDRSFRPPTDAKNGRKTRGGDRKGGRHQSRE